MTKDQYLRMVEQTGEEIDWDRCPPEGSDFPLSVSNAVNIFHSLGDRIYGDVGYVGKDFTTLTLLMQLYGVETAKEKDWLIELLLHLERRTITESQKRMKAEMDKIKRK